MVTTLRHERTLLCCFHCSVTKGTIRRWWEISHAPRNQNHEIPGCSLILTLSESDALTHIGLISTHYDWSRLDRQARRRKVSSFYFSYLSFEHQQSKLSFLEPHLHSVKTSDSYSAIVALLLLIGTVSLLRRRGYHRGLFEWTAGYYGLWYGLEMQLPSMFLLFSLLLLLPQLSSHLLSHPTLLHSITHTRPWSSNSLLGVNLSHYTVPGQLSTGSWSCFSLPGWYFIEENTLSKK